MNGRLSEALDEVEAACAAIDAALVADDLDAAGLGNQELNAKLGILVVLLDDPAALMGDLPLESVAARLRRVLDRHDALTRQLTGERDRAADEIRGIKSGHRAATHYLDTAAGVAP